MWLILNINSVHHCTTYIAPDTAGRSRGLIWRSSKATRRWLLTIDESKWKD